MCSRGTQPDYTLHLILVGLLHRTMFFPFLVIPFNKSIGVEYFVEFVFVEEVLIELSACSLLEESVGTRLILFLCWDIRVTSLMLTASVLSLMAHQTTTCPSFLGTGDLRIASYSVLSTLT